jgi:hypothetical protein
MFKETRTIYSLFEEEFWSNYRFIIRRNVYIAFRNLNTKKVEKAHLSKLCFLQDLNERLN